MSISNSIAKILNILDDNIIFNENSVEETKINGKRSLIISAYLNEYPKYCPSCGVVKDNKIVKYGYSHIKNKNT